MIKFKQYITEMIHGPTPNISSYYTNEKDKSLYNLHDSLTYFHSDKVNENDHEQIRHYTSEFEHGSYLGINQHLNTGNQDGPTQTMLGKRISDLNNLVTSHEAPHDFHVYSGIKHDPSEGKEHKEPFKAHIKQFTSASIHPGVARSFSALPKHDKFSHMLKIHIPKGSKHGVYVGKLSAHKGEYEFLMKPNLKLKIHHEPEIQSRHKIWHATIED